MPKTKNAIPVTWAFEWKEGGYNTVLAVTKEEAIAKGNKMHPACIVNPHTVTSDPNKIEAIEAHWAGCCN